MSETIRDAVQSKYASVARSGLSGQQDGVRGVAEAFGYTPEQLASIPAEANMGLSCGNPTAFASLKPGETVVDLGCGGGLDVFLAAARRWTWWQGNRHRHDARDDRAGSPQRRKGRRRLRAPERRVLPVHDRPVAASRCIGGLRHQQLRHQPRAGQAGRFSRDCPRAQAGRAVGRQRHRAEEALATRDQPGSDGVRRLHRRSDPHRRLSARSR